MLYNLIIKRKRETKMKLTKEQKQEEKAHNFIKTYTFKVL